MHDEFKALKVDVIVVSTDALTTHENWIKGLEQIKYKDQDPIKIDFPLIDDQVLEVSSKYGMLHTQDNSNEKVKDVRALLIYTLVTHFKPIKKEPAQLDLTP